jgi:hypothetical protein
MPSLAALPPLSTRVERRQVVTTTQDLAAITEALAAPT